MAKLASHIFRFLVLLLVSALASARVLPFRRFMRPPVVPVRSKPLSRPFTPFDLPSSGFLSGGLVGGAGPGLFVVDDFGASAALAPPNSLGNVGVSDSNYGYDLGDTGAVIY